MRTFSDVDDAHSRQAAYADVRMRRSAVAPSARRLRNQESG